MKLTNHFVRITATALCLLAFASASFAKTNPLSYPKGLAVDSKGYLWVANSGDNNVLAFSPGYALQTADTITEGISNPSGVAFDPLGNLWVANYGTSNGGANGSVSEYTAGKQITANSITNDILGPQAIAVDGLGNVWVENDYVNVTIYDSPSGFAPPTSLLRTLTPSYPVYGIAVGAGEFSWGSNTGVSFVAATPALVSASLCCDYASNDTGVALAIDAKGNIYMGNLDGSVWINSPLAYEYQFLQLSFVPSGIAIDNVRGRVYFSNYNGNSISVYSTTGTLLKVIE
jgi:DNA-binding beta-propeller fold protein YncE